MQAHLAHWRKLLRFSGFHYVSFVNQIRKLLSLFYFYLTMAQYQLKQNERLICSNLNWRGK